MLGYGFIVFAFMYVYHNFFLVFDSWICQCMVANSPFEERAGFYLGN